MRALGILGAFALLGAVGGLSAEADVRYEVVARTTDSLTRGTVVLEETVTVSVKGDRIRQEVKGARTVVTRRGARYTKPGHRVTLDQVDRGVRYEINLDAGTYAEESFASLRQQHQDTIAAAERTFRVSAAGPPPSLAVTVDRTGERARVHERECERVVLSATKEVVLAATRGGGPVGASPSRFSMTFDLCVVPETARMREVRDVEERVENLTGMRGALAERQLRVFAGRRDVLAVFELMQRLLEREREKLGGTPIRWERVFVGPRGAEPQATLYRYRGEVTRVEERVLDPGAFELPSGLTLDNRRPSADRQPTE